MKIYLFLLLCWFGLFMKCAIERGYCCTVGVQDIGMRWVWHVRPLCLFWTRGQNLLQRLYNISVSAWLSLCFWKYVSLLYCVSWRDIVQVSEYKARVLNERRWVFCFCFLCISFVYICSALLRTKLGPSSSSSGPVRCWDQCHSPLCECDLM